MKNILVVFFAIAMLPLNAAQNSSSAAVYGTASWQDFVLFSIKKGISSFIASQIAFRIKQFGTFLTPRLIADPDAQLQSNALKRSECNTRLAELTVLEEERKQVEANMRLTSEQQKTIATQKLSAKTPKAKQACEKLEGDLLELLAQQNNQLKLLTEKMQAPAKK